MKKVIKTIFILILSSLALNVNAQEFITGVGVNYGIGKKWDLGVELQSRNNRASEVNTHSWIVQGKISYDLFERLSLGATYRNTSTETINHFTESDIENLDKNRYAADITYKSKRFDNDLKFSHRLRYQYSEHDDDAKEYIRYKFTTCYKLSKNAKPYVSVEPYYYLNKNKFKYARLYLGNEFNFNRTKLDVFLITETEPTKEVFALHYMLGVKVKFNFNALNKL